MMTSKLLFKLEKDGIGCWVGNYFLGALGYADDLTLLVPSARGLQHVLKTCESFGSEYDIQYNATKTVCMLFSLRKVQPPVVSLNGIALQWVDSFRHLGNYIDSNLSECTEVNKKKSDLFQRTNTLLVTLGRCQTCVVSNVFNSQCAHFYGAQAWYFKDKSVTDFTIA